MYAYSWLQKECSVSYVRELRIEMFYLMRSKWDSVCVCVCVCARMHTCLHAWANYFLDNSELLGMCPGFHHLPKSEVLFFHVCGHGVLAYCGPGQQEE